MQIGQVVELLKYIKAAYPRFDITEKSAEVWFEFLHEQSYEKVQGRLKKHIRDSKFEPTISDMLPSKEDINRDHVMDLQRRYENQNDEPSLFPQSS